MTGTTTLRSLRLLRLLASSASQHSHHHHYHHRHRSIATTTVAASAAAAPSPSSAPPPPPAGRGGLFGVRHLRRPEDLLAWADASIAECRALAARLASPRTPPDGPAVVALMDALSDAACRAYDACECCRHVHGAPAWRAAAGAACARLGAYVAAVNHDAAVADKLAAAMRRYELGARAMAQGGGSGGGAAGAAAATTEGRREQQQHQQQEQHQQQAPPLPPPLPPMSPAEVRAFSGEAALVGARLAEDFERSGLRLRDAEKRARMQALLGASAHWPASYSRNLSGAGGALGGLALDGLAAARLPPEWRDELLAAGAAAAAGRGGAGARNGRAPGRRAAAGAGPAAAARLLLPLDGGSLARFLSSVPDEAAREAAWRAGQASPSANARVAARMLRGRAEMAALLGARSYAALKTSRGGGALAGAPGAVAAFLASAADQVAPLADAEAERLRRAKCRHTADPSARLRAWDVDFYSACEGGRGGGAAAAAAAAAPYLHLPSVLEGLGELVLRVFGVRMRLEPLGPGEAWAPGVVRVGLLNEDSGGGGGGGGGAEGAFGGGGGGDDDGWRSPAPPAPGERLATLYLDLCPRPGKTPGSVLFPVRCGRAIPPPGSGLGGSGGDGDGGGDAGDCSSGSYQTPVMVLVMSIGGGAGGGEGGGDGGERRYDDGGGGAAGSGGGPSNSSSWWWRQSASPSPPLPPSVPDLTLSWRELRTLVHEAGHALHNACSRTRYQHLWGTRCAQDVVEVPSHLFEHFLSDPRSAAVLARHRGPARAPLPAALHARLRRGMDASFPALELQHQALLALADQACHGGGPAGFALEPASLLALRIGGDGGGGEGDDEDEDDEEGEAGDEGAVASIGAAVSSAWGALSDRYAPSVPFVAGSQPHLRFAHLSTYGAAYYAYPYAKCLAAALWSEFFARPASSSSSAGGGAGGPLDPAAGRALRRRLLEPGGAREPRELLGSLLGERAGREVDGGFAPDPANWVRSVRSGGQED